MVEGILPRLDADFGPTSKNREGPTKERDPKWNKHKAGMRGVMTASSRKTTIGVGRGTLKKSLGHSIGRCAQKRFEMMKAIKSYNFMNYRIFAKLGIG